MVSKKVSEDFSWNKEHGFFLISRMGIVSYRAISERLKKILKGSLGFIGEKKRRTFALPLF